MARHRKRLALVVVAMAGLTLVYQGVIGSMRPLSVAEEEPQPPVMRVAREPMRTVVGPTDEWLDANHEAAVPTDQSATNRDQHMPQVTPPPMLEAPTILR